MLGQHDAAFDHAQSVVVLATCTALVWSDSFEIATQVLVGLQASLVCVKRAYLFHLDKLTRRAQAQTQADSQALHA